LTIRIRPFEEEDRPALQQLYLQVRQQTFTWLDTTAFSLQDFDEETAGETVLVALAGEVVVGFIAVWLPDHFIHHLYIFQAFQQKGIGARLLAAVTSKLAPPITLKCWQQNKTAIRFYKQHGFVEKEQVATDEGGYIVFRYGGKAKG
jgi:GNAT superfamily N-acetyltransferase